jgi:hypothetical protein
MTNFATKTPEHQDIRLDTLDMPHAYRGLLPKPLHPGSNGIPVCRFGVPP